MPQPDTLRSLPDWWLEVRCACGRVAQFPLALLAKRHGPDARLPPLVSRMRCEGCGGRPTEAELVDDPQRAAAGYAGGQAAVRRPVE